MRDVVGAFGADGQTAIRDSHKKHSHRRGASRRACSLSTQARRSRGYPPPSRFNLSGDKDERPYI